MGGSSLFGVRIDMCLYEFIGSANIDLIFGGNHCVHSVKEEVHCMECSFVCCMTKEHRCDFLNVPAAYEAIFLWEREELSLPSCVHILQLSRIRVDGVVTIAEVHSGVGIRYIE